MGQVKNNEANVWQSGQKIKSSVFLDAQQCVEHNNHSAAPFQKFNSDKVKNNEVQGYLFFTPNVTPGGHFFALAQNTKANSKVRG